MSHLVSVVGTLRGYDTLVNLVLDDCTEYIRGTCSFSLCGVASYATDGGGLDIEDQYKTTSETRNLGLVVCRGSAVMLICPKDGTEEISNPFAQEGVI